MSELMKVKVSSSPHIRAEDTTRSIMLDVIIALMPALAVGIFVFGGRAAAAATKGKHNYYRHCGADCFLHVRYGSFRSNA